MVGTSIMKDMYQVRIHNHRKYCLFINMLFMRDQGSVNHVAYTEVLLTQCLISPRIVLLQEYVLN